MRFDFRSWSWGKKARRVRLVRVPAGGLVCLMALCGFACSGPEPPATGFHNPKMPMERRVSELIRLMRPEEKLALVRGARNMSMAENERLGIPALRVVQGAMGVSAQDEAGKPIVATAFPANIGVAATWNPELAEQIGGVIGQQARALGRGEVLGPIADVSHSALSGRVFETYGEDPWLVSRMVYGYVTGVQEEGEIATAMFDGEAANTRVAREHDLRPLETAVTEAGVWAVMPRTGSGLGFLKSELGFRGFIVRPGQAADLAAGDEEAINGEVRSILRAMFASGVFDRLPASVKEIETTAQRAVARAAATQSIVLLRNQGGVLPLDRNKVRSVAVFGPNAAVNRMAGGSYTVAGRYSDSPLDALRKVLGSGVVTAPGSPADAAHADAAIVFVGTGANSEVETVDRTSLSLPDEQEKLIEAVARANPRTIVVVIAGYPIAMEKWITDVPAVLDAWFPGEEGGHAIADVLTGMVNPSGRLPLAFPGGGQPLFPFGFGLSYTEFEYSDLVVMPQEVPPGQFAEISLNVRNSGSRAGTETVQLYLRAAHAGARGTPDKTELRAFQQVDLAPAESKRVHFTLPGNAVEYFDEKRQAWVRDSAEFEVGVGSSSADIKVTGTFETTE